jgi:hypothetical protein
VPFLQIYRFYGVYFVAGEIEILLIFPVDNVLFLKNYSGNFLKLFWKSFPDFILQKFSWNIFKNFPGPENIPIHSSHYPPHSTH